MKKMNLDVLEKMNFENGVKELTELGYYISGNGKTESNISDYVVDTYYTLEDDEGNEVDVVSFSQFMNGRDDEDHEADVVREGWSRL